MPKNLQPQIPFDRAVIDQILEATNVDPANASIREMVLVVGEAEKTLKAKFLRMEFGVPGLEPCAIGMEAEMEALHSPRTIASYPPVTGLPILKEAGSRFIKQFLNLAIPPSNVIPTVGSMQGSFIAQAVTARREAGKDTIAFIDPCFSVHRIQSRFLGLKEESIDLYERREWLDRLEAICEKGRVVAVLYSSPNNPTWVILSEGEMQRLGEICTKYDVVAIEDSAYFGMDFRVDYSVPGKPPYPPTVARYTDNCILLLSSAKIFSYAGQRVGLTYISPRLAQRTFPGLMTHFGYPKFIDAFVMAGVYCTTSGVSTSPQYGLAAMLNAASDGRYNFLKAAREYAERAKVLRKIMTDNGFTLVYDRDLDEPLSDGFFFTFAYPNMRGDQLVKELLYYGISSTTLAITKSNRPEAVRACVSLIGRDDFPVFEERIRAFRRDHP